MLDGGTAKGTAYPAYVTQEPVVAANSAQEIILEPRYPAGDYALASETSLASIWLTPEEDEAWRHL